jgi:hypothetical protein
MVEEKKTSTHNELKEAKEYQVWLSSQPEYLDVVCDNTVEKLK